MGVISICLLGGGYAAYRFSSFAPAVDKINKTDAKSSVSFSAPGPSLNKECGPVKGAEVSEADCVASQKHYLEGLKIFQSSDEYEKAAAEWGIALRYYPGNENAVTGLRRIQDITNPDAISRATAVSEADRLKSRKHYLEGVKFYGAGDTAAALREWYAALRLDINNDDAAARIYKTRGLKPGFSTAGAGTQSNDSAK